jgi:hypothetical protein
MDDLDSMCLALFSFTKHSSRLAVELASEVSS